MYNYYEELANDIREYINYNIDCRDYDTLDELRESLYDIFFTEDSITGNASGSYFFSRYKAEEAICHNLDIYEDACNEWGEPERKNDPETIDVTIRCYLLGQVLDEVLEDYEENFEG